MILQLRAVSGASYDVDDTGHVGQYRVQVSGVACVTYGESQAMDDGVHAITVDMAAWNATDEASTDGDDE
jgi:hypothetical protein